MIGTVRKIVREKGFGFIEDGAGHADWFFHASAVEGIAWADLDEGVRVAFEPGESKQGKGPRAEHVRVYKER